jgi:hypothetical protein
LTSAEIYNPQTATFSATGSLATARKSHTGSLLQDGRVLITGGKSATGDLDSAEIFDPTTALFHTTGPMNVGRALHTATLLNDGRTLIAGGVVTGGNETDSVELFSPLTEAFSVTGSLSLKRKRHRATLQNDGTVLISGGNTLPNSQGGGDRTTDTAERYNPTTGLFHDVQNMSVARSEHESTLLADGTTLMTGGTLTNVPSDVFDPSTEAFSTVGAMIQVRARHVALRLTSPKWKRRVGQVLVIGGDITGGPIFGGAQQALDSVEIYDPATKQFSFLGTMTVARQNHTATELKDGSILIAGGVGRPFISKTAEIVIP